MKECKKPSSGQDIFISQINTLAGVESQRWYQHQYWCNSLHQNQLLELGLVFTEKEKAESHTKKLVGIDKEPKPKRTKTTYEKVSESIFDLKEQFEHGELYQLVNKSEYRKIKNIECLATCLKYGSAHRKVITEITEREAFIELARGLIDKSKDADCSLGKMFDAGCRFK